VEALEPRHLLATLTVNTTSDIVDGVTASIASLVSNPGSDGAISLREAIQAANNTANTGAPDEIHFAIPGAGERTIQPATALPTVTNPVVIDAATQPGYAGEPLIELDGTSAGSANGLYITAGGSTIRGLVINRFSAYGIRLRNGAGNLIEGNYIGTDVTGTIAQANGVDGIDVQDAANNTIGGVTAAARNVISGNADDGVMIGGNGVYDVLDVPLTLTGSGMYDAQSQTYRFQGNSSIQTLPHQNPSGQGDDITLNQVSGAQYRVEGEDWMDIAVYQQYTAALDLIIPAPPNRTLEIRTIDDASGVTSPVFAADAAANELRLLLSDAPFVENSGVSAATVTRVTAETIAAPLTVTLASSDTTEATVPASVVIPANMSSATFYVTANDEALLDDTQAVVIQASASGYVSGTQTRGVLDHETLTVVVEAAQVSEEAGATIATVTRSNTDNGAALLVTLISSDTAEATVPATATNTDDDTAGITVTPISHDTSESGGTATFTIVLDTQPASDVVIGIGSGDLTEGLVWPASVRFTSVNWNVVRTITVSGEDDSVVDGDVTFTVFTGAAASTDANYSGLDAADVTVTNLDNDTAGIAVGTISRDTTEAGGTATFTMVLTSQPTADVTIGLSSSDASEGSVTPASVTFTAANWNILRIVTVTGVNDDLDDGDVEYTIVTAAAASADGNYNGLNAADVSVTNSDDDTGGITVSPTSGLITTESGGTATFTIVLNTQPTGDVKIGPASSDTSEGNVSPASVTFKAANWNTPQTVTVIGVNDHMDDGDVAYTIATAAAASTDAHYNGLDAADVSVTNADDDTAGITVTPISGDTSEGGGTATFTIVLDTQPASDVVIGISSSDLTEGLVWPATVRFTSANWNVIRTITVSGEDDPVDDGDVAFTVFTGAAASTDANYSGFDAADVSVTNLDNDTAGITVGAISRNTTETGGTATFTMALTSQPTADVTVGLTSSDASEGSVTPASVTFTAANWNILRIVTVSGVNDDLDDGDVEYTIITAPATSTDANYRGMNDADVSVTNTDDDTAGITVSPTSGSTVTEAGGTAWFTAVLTAQPVTNVVVTVTSGDPGEAAVSPAALTFTLANWNLPQTVTVTGVDDFDRDGDQVTSLTIAVDAAQSDDGFAAVAAQTVSVTTIDDDLGWHNTGSPFDVDASGRVDAADVLTIINYINAHGSDPSLPPPPASPPPFYDVDDDGLCMPNDVLLVINYINNGGTGSSGEGEGEGAGAAATPSGDGLATVAPREPVQIASVRVRSVPTHRGVLGSAGSSFGAPFFVDLWGVRDLSYPAGATLPASPATVVSSQGAGDLPMSARGTKFAPLAVSRRGVMSDAVFDAWPDAPWDEPADTLAWERHRVNL
jgi:hypothetical protein